MQVELDGLDDGALGREIVLGRPGVMERVDDEATAVDVDDVPVERLSRLGVLRQPVVVGPKIKNVPKEGYYAWDPGGYIGLYQPDTFWVAQ